MANSSIPLLAKWKAENLRDEIFIQLENKLNKLIEQLEDSVQDKIRGYLKTSIMARLALKHWGNHNIIVSAIKEEIDLDLIIADVIL